MKHQNYRYVRHIPSSRGPGEDMVPFPVCSHPKRTKPNAFGVRNVVLLGIPLARPRPPARNRCEPNSGRDVIGVVRVRLGVAPTVRSSSSDPPILDTKYIYFDQIIICFFSNQALSTSSVMVKWAITI
jgi:hypothetical protein